jgi:hypothetical protein
MSAAAVPEILTRFNERVSSQSKGLFIPPVMNVVDMFPSHAASFTGPAPGKGALPHVAWL